MSHRDLEEQAIMTLEINNLEDIIDVRDIIERVQELEEISCFTKESDEEKREHTCLKHLLSELKGNGGDEQWRGHWYPVQLIRNSYFVKYAQELCEDCEDVPPNLPPYIEIDWQATARNIRFDYSCVDFGGVTYWYR